MPDPCHKGTPCVLKQRKQEYQHEHSSEFHLYQKGFLAGRNFLVLLSNSAMIANKTLPFGSETLLEIRQRTLTILLIVNVVVLAIAGGFGYALAGITLKPIEMMLQKQKRFISDAAHEIKTPLTAMKTDLEVTLRDKNLNLDKARVSLESSIEEIDKLHRFTTNLLKQSRYQAGANQNRKTDVSLNILMEKICNRMANMANKKEVHFDKDFKDIIILGDAVELEELFTNLIDNAIKYSKPHGTVKITVDKNVGQALVKVSDDGIGIDKEDLPNIFEPFYRADVSRNKSTHDGFGLGLAISKEIVTNHGGSIHVTSMPEEGTIFTITLPLAK
jgi:signal transduction histidine kinase